MEGEEVDDAVDGLGSVDGMQRAHHEVPCLGGREGGRDGLHVAHLPDQDVVGVLAQNVLESRHVAVGVQADLALVDDRLLVLMQHLDGIFDRDDVAAHGLVDVVYHRRQGGGLARARGAGDEHQAARLQRYPADHIRQAQLLKGGHRGRHLTHGDADATALTEDVDAEAALVGERVGKVDLVVLREAPDLLVRHDRGGRVLGVVGHHRRVIEHDEFAVHTDHGRTAGLDVQVGSVARG